MYAHYCSLQDVNMDTVEKNQWKLVTEEYGNSRNNQKRSLALRCEEDGAIKRAIVCEEAEIELRMTRG